MEKEQKGEEIQKRRLEKGDTKRKTKNGDKLEIKTEENLRWEKLHVNKRKVRGKQNKVNRLKEVGKTDKLR